MLGLWGYGGGDQIHIFIPFMWSQVSKVFGEVFKEVFGEAFREMFGEMFREMFGEIFGEVLREVFGKMFKEMFGKMFGEALREMFWEVLGEMFREMFGEVFTGTWRALQCEVTLGRAGSQEKALIPHHSLHWIPDSQETGRQELREQGRG